MSTPQRSSSPPGKRVALVVSSLSAGGAERVVVELAGFLSNLPGYYVQCITTRPPEEDFFSLPPEVERRVVDNSGESKSLLDGLHRNIAAARSIRGIIKDSKVDVVVSFLTRTNARTVVSCTGLKASVIVSERNDVSQPLSGLWAFLRRRTYSRAQALVVQTQRNANGFASLLRNSVPVEIIPNAISTECLYQLSERKRFSVPEAMIPGRTLVAAGRLEYQKGFDLLLRAFADSVGNSGFRLVILGEGKLRATLIEQSIDLGIQDKVHFVGNQHNPFPYLAAAEIFVLSSRYEGFPNVLLEALAFGCACLSFDCASGPREIITHEVDGVLVPPEDTEALTEKLRELMANEQLRKRLGQAAAQSVQRFFPENVLPQWQRLIESM